MVTAKRKPKAKPVDPRVKEIMRTFDFDLVQKVMLDTGWTWATSKQPDRIPTLREIRQTARECLGILIDTNVTRYGTGGFMVEKYKDGTLELRFELDTAQGFPED